MSSGENEKSSMRSLAWTSALALTLTLALALAVIATGMTRGAAPRDAGNGLAYSSASARAVQRQPPSRICRARGAGLSSRPDAACTPGALNPEVTQASIGETICRAGWTATVRPAEWITAVEKRASMRSYGNGAVTSSYEYDHLVPLALGGAVNDARNLWPEPDYTLRSGFYLNPKDRLERALNQLVCDGTIALSHAQSLLATDWVSALRRYG